MTMIHAIQRAVDYIEAHLDDPFILDHAAEAAYMSIPNLYRGFYKLLGHTPKNYVRKRRVSNAAWHLRYTARSIEEISIMTGFMTESSFSKIFKKLTGLPPSAYRNADRHYIFDPIRIIDKVQLRDDKAWGSAYPNVNVKQLEPMHVIRHVYRADTEQGIECAAIRSVMGQLHWTDEGKRHLFGRNIEFRETPMYGYELMIPAAEGADDPLPGGLYAVSTVTSTNEKDIVQEWNRLQSEWLPQSGFTLGRHVLFEEFVMYGSQISRMKLYLPVVKRTDPDYIEIRQYKEMRVAFFRSYGENAQQTSERKLLAWAAETGLPAPWQPYRCYITYRFDSSESSDYWWEAGVSIDRIPANPKAEAVYKMIGFGLYACLPAKAWGSMQGVVERVHRWLSGNAHYAYDESRDWLIEYDTLAATMDGHSSAVCAIPVMRNSNGGFVK